MADVTGRSEALVLVSGIEVTERRRLEVEKERERAFLNAIANNAPSMLCLIDAEGRLTERGGNIAFERTLGYEPSDVGGQVLWEDFVDPAEADEVRTLVEAVSAGARPKEHDNTWVARDGRRLSVAWTLHAAARDRRAPPFPDHRCRHHGAQAHDRGPACVESAPRTGRGSRAAHARAEPPRRGAAARRSLGRTAPRRVQARVRPVAATGLLTGAREELTQALADLRELARGIHPAVLTDRGLRPALEMLAYAGHGGQILVSADTLGALADMPSRDLGEFWLEGLADPERIHQLIADVLPRDFPPSETRSRHWAQV